MKALKMGLVGLGLLFLSGCAGSGYSYYSEDVVVGVGVSSGSYYDSYYYPTYHHHYRYRPYYYYPRYYHYGW